MIAILPAGPYLILTPTGVKAGEDELTSGWLPARIWESRYLLQQPAGATTRDLQFTGLAIPLATRGLALCHQDPGRLVSAAPLPDRPVPDPPPDHARPVPSVPADQLRAPPRDPAPRHMVNQPCEPAPLLHRNPPDEPA